MKGWGSNEYLFMGIPICTAISLKLGLPLIPQPMAWASHEDNNGYRADQSALYILMDIVHRGKITDRHREFIKRLFDNQPVPSPVVIEMFLKCHGPHDISYPEITDEDRDDWGSCPGPVYRWLVKFIQDLKV